MVRGVSFLKHPLVLICISVPCSVWFHTLLPLHPLFPLPSIYTHTHTHTHTRTLVCLRAHTHAYTRYLSYTWVAWQNCKKKMMYVDLGSLQLCSNATSLINTRPLGMVMGWPCHEAPPACHSYWTSSIFALIPMVMTSRSLFLLPRSLFWKFLRHIFWAACHTSLLCSRLKSVSPPVLSVTEHNPFTYISLSRLHHVQITQTKALSIMPDTFSLSHDQQHHLVELLLWERSSDPVRIYSLWSSLHPRDIQMFLLSEATEAHWSWVTCPFSTTYNWPSQDSRIQSQVAPIHSQ